MHEMAGETYRVVRHLAPRDGVHCAVVDDGTGAAELVVIPQSDRASWEHLVRVMAAVSSPHLPAVRDIALDPDGTLRLVRSLVSGESVDVLLETPGWCTPGRAVTLLHPVVATVRAAHELGAVLGGPDARRIRVVSDGRPVIAELSGAFCAAPLPAPLRAKDPGHQADILALEKLRTMVRHALEQAGYADTAASLPTVGDALADPDVRLRWSGAEPLLSPGATAAPVPDTVVLELPADAPHDPAGAVATLTRVLNRVGLPRDVTSHVDNAAMNLATCAARTRTAVSRLPLRTRIVAVAGVAMLVAVMVTAMLPASPPSPAAETTTAAESEAGAGAEPDHANSGDTTQAGEDPTRLSAPEEWSVIVDALVTRWQTCVREQRMLCDEALHASSRAAESRTTGADTALESLVALIDGVGVEITVVERSGDAAVLQLHVPDMTPASLLMIRSEAGWRIRDAWS